MSIPKEVLALLGRHRWNHIPGLTEDIVKRRRDGNFYIFHANNPDESNLGGFTWREVLALGTAGAFGSGVYRTGDGDDLAVNEHAAHSLEEFLGACCKAWQDHQDRLTRYVVKSEESSSVEA